MVFACPVCLEENSEEQAVLLPCEHKLCSLCFDHYLRSHVADGRVIVRCVFPDCMVVIPEEFVRRLCPDELKGRYDYLVQIRSNPLLRQCPFCGQLKKGNPKNPNMKCDKCDQSFCYFHSNAHPETTPCDVYEAAQKKEAWSVNASDGAEIDTMVCPGCGAITSKSEGCNHMICSYCATDWCWRCGKTLTFGGDLPIHYSWWNPFGCTFSQFDDDQKTCCFGVLCHKVLAVTLGPLFLLTTIIIFILTFPLFFPCYICCPGPGGISIIEYITHFFSWISIISFFLFIIIGSPFLLHIPPTRDPFSVSLTLDSPPTRLSLLRH